MIDFTLDIDYGELVDAAGWLAESPFLVDGTEQPTAEKMLASAAQKLQVDPEGLWQLASVSIAGVLNEWGLGADDLDVLLDQRSREFFLLLGIAAGRGKCPGP